MHYKRIYYVGRDGVSKRIGRRNYQQEIELAAIRRVLGGDMQEIIVQTPPVESWETFKDSYLFLLDPSHNRAVETLTQFVEAVEGTISGMAWCLARTDQFGPEIVHVSKTYKTIKRLRQEYIDGNLFDPEEDECIIFLVPFHE